MPASLIARFLLSFFGRPPLPLVEEVGVDGADLALDCALGLAEAAGAAAEAAEAAAAE